LSVVSVLCCQVEVSATSCHSSRGVLPTLVRRCVWSRNIKNGCSIYIYIYDISSLRVNSNWYRHALCWLYQLLFIYSCSSWWWAASLLETCRGLFWNKLRVSSANFCFILYEAV
jgi:hypothetical protein